MQTSHFSLQIGDDKIAVTSFDLPKKTGQAVAGRTHHIWMLDASYSMQYAIDDLKRQAIELSKSIKANDLLSVFYFASEGQYGALVVGAKVDDDVSKLISQLHVMGCTCFSEVTTEAAKCAEQLNSLVDQTVVTLFTDGCAVTNKPEEVEEKLTVEAVQKIASVSNLVAFNAIGYTSRYNARFLNGLVGLTTHGRFVHASDISRFREIMTSNMETVGALSARKISVATGGDMLLYLTSKTCSSAIDELSLTTVDNDRNTVFVIADEGEESEITFTDNNHSTILGILDRMKTPASDALRLDFIYAFAARNYARGDRQIALDLIAKEARDVALADMIQSAFTVEETGEVQNRLEAAALGAGRYIKGTAPADYLPAADAYCVMDLFADIFAHPKDILFVPFSKNVPEYSRIGRKVEAHQDHFVKSVDEVRQPLTSFIFNKERLNISVQVTIPGEVNLNPKSLDRVNALVEEKLKSKPSSSGVLLPKKYPSRVIRTLSIIQDGQLNMSELEFLIEHDLWIRMQTNTNLSWNTMGSETIDGRTYDRIVLMIGDLPIINRIYIDRAKSIEDIHRRVVELTHLEGAARVVNYHLDAVLEAGKSRLAKQDEYANLTADQITFLQESGISKSGIYNPPDRAVAKVGESDFYMARKLAFSIKGSTLPSVADFLEMKNYQPGEKKNKPAAGKQPNWSGSAMLDYERGLLQRATTSGLDVSKPTAKLRDFFQAEQSSIEQQVLAARFDINGIKLAKVMTGDWFTGLTKTAKGELVHELPGATTMVVKTERTRIPV